MAQSSATTDALRGQKTVAVVKRDAYQKQLLELFREIGVPETDWEGRLANIWGRVVATMQEEVEEEKRRVRNLSESVEVHTGQLLQLYAQLGRDVES